MKSADAEKFYWSHINLASPESSLICHSVKTVFIRYRYPSKDPLFSSCTEITKLSAREIDFYVISHLRLQNLSARIVVGFPLDGIQSFPIFGNMTRLSLREAPSELPFEQIPKLAQLAIHHLRVLHDTSNEFLITAICRILSTCPHLKRFITSCKPFQSEVETPSVLECFYKPDAIPLLLFNKEPQSIGGDHGDHIKGDNIWDKAERFCE